MRETIWYSCQIGNDNICGKENISSTYVSSPSSLFLRRQFSSKRLLTKSEWYDFSTFVEVRFWRSLLLVNLCSYSVSHEIYDKKVHYRYCNYHYSKAVLWCYNPQQQQPQDDDDHFLGLFLFRYWTTLITFSRASSLSRCAWNSSPTVSFYIQELFVDLDSIFWIFWLSLSPSSLSSLGKYHHFHSLQKDITRSQSKKGVSYSSTKKP